MIMKWQYKRNILRVPKYLSNLEPYSRNIIYIIDSKKSGLCNKHIANYLIVKHL